MKTAEKEIITAFLDKTLNMSAEKVAPLFTTNGDDHELKPEALDTLLGEYATMVKSYKDKEKTLFDNGYKKAQSEVLTAREKALKEKYAVNSEKTGDELIDDIIASKIPAKGAMDDEKVKVHPVFLNMEKELNQKIKLATEEGATKLKEFEQNVAKEKTFSNVVSKASKELETLKPILPKDATKADNQKQLLIKELEGFSYELNGDEIVVLKDGKRHEDAYGKPITFAALVKETAGKYWDFEQGTEHKGNGAENGSQGAQGQAGQGAKWNGAIPKNDDEYSRIFPTLKTAEERMAFTKAYDGQFSKT